MPNNDTAKTKWGPKRILVFVAMVGLLGATIFAVTALPHGSATRAVRIGNASYNLEVADTNVARTQGLSGRVTMPADHGMLFSYDNQDIRCFWMKDMRFPLDILWVNARNQIVHVQNSAMPDSYPHVFCANAPAKYVIELRAGQAVEHKMYVGQMIQL